MAHICARPIALGFLWGSDSLFTRRSIVRRPVLGTLFASTVNNMHWLDFIVMPLLSWRVTSLFQDISRAGAGIKSLVSTSLL